MQHYYSRGEALAGLARLLFWGATMSPSDNSPARPDRLNRAPDIGGGNNLEPGSFWSGLIDDIKIYGPAVTP